jgi:hypothetical protein
VWRLLVGGGVVGVVGWVRCAARVRVGEYFVTKDHGKERKHWGIGCQRRWPGDELWWPWGWVVGFECGGVSGVVWGGRGVGAIVVVGVGEWIRRRFLGS